VESCGSEPDRQHEALCRRCGRCCFHKLLVGDEVVYTDTPCVYLDLETHQCTVYERRHEVNPDCLDVDAGIARGVFPADCPYVAGLASYKPPVEDPSDELLADLLAAPETEEAG
jgi:uncharacterized cysteine cluster protein YcgN (CxxCxxCC family)